MIIIGTIILFILIMGLVIKNDLKKRKAKLKKRRQNQTASAYRVRVYVDNPDGGFHCETRDENGNLVF